MKPKIFISSTYLDLIAYRKKLWDALSNIDVDILGMEKFGARSSSALQTCLEEVAKSDIYVGILAYKYGSIDKVTKKSYTELEYERAVKFNKEILIYLFDEMGFIQPHFIDFGTNADKLLKFKKLLKKHHTIDTFLNPEDLSFKVVNKIYGVIPKLPFKLIRPRILKAKLHRFTINKKNWISFVGYIDEKPLEVFTCMQDDEMFPIPLSITSGEIIQSNGEDKLTRYDFQFIDRYGYTNTMGGLKHKFDKTISQYDSIITEMLMENTPLRSVIGIVNKMELDNSDMTAQWRMGIIQALKMI